MQITRRNMLTAGVGNPAYPLQVNHLGDHLRKRRMDLGLTRKAAAKLIGTNAWSLKGWEENVRANIRPMFIRRCKRFCRPA